jgi:hypothetical protein
LLKYLNATEQANGFANRILWAAVRRSKLLPDGGEIHRLDHSDIIRRLRESVQFARTVGEVRRSDAARDIWHAVYPRLAGDRLGLFGAVTSRAEAQTMRLALVYALLDSSSLIQAEHLSAGLAVWSYCEASARLIFGDALGDVTADEVLKALRGAANGLTRTEVSGGAQPRANGAHAAGSGHTGKGGHHCWAASRALACRRSGYERNEFNERTPWGRSMTPVLSLNSFLS